MIARNNKLFVVTVTKVSTLAMDSVLRIDEMATMNTKLVLNKLSAR